jgi:hypothetical protein
MKLVVAQIKGCIDGFEWFKVNVHSFFLSVVSQNSSTVENKAVVRNSRVQFQLLLSRSDSTEYRQSNGT